MMVVVDDLQMEEIVSKYGVVVYTRCGSDIDSFIYESDLLTKYMVLVFILP